MKELNDIEKETVVSFADSNMNLSSTGRLIFAHRNTVLYRLTSVQEKTGLNPFNFYDLYELVRLIENDSI